MQKEEQEKRLKSGEPVYDSGGKLKHNRKDVKQLKREEHSYATADQSSEASAKRRKVDGNSDHDGDSLAALASAYDSDADPQQSDAELTDAASSRHESARSLVGQPTGKPFCKNFGKGKCKRGDQCPLSHNPADRVQQLQTPKKKEQNQGKQAKRHHQNFRQSLLSKVLEKDIHRENSVILRCFRFFRQNNFFESTES